MSFEGTQFLKVAAGMKEYPNFQVRDIVVSSGTIDWSPSHWILATTDWFPRID